MQIKESHLFLSPEKGTAEKIVSSGVLPILAQVLRKKSRLTSQVTLLVAEMAREGKLDTLCCLYLYFFSIGYFYIYGENKKPLILLLYLCPRLLFSLTIYH